jgi:pantetheine-phosphate adenylyltransferase
MDEPVTRRVVCPGSFDPITNGHLDIIGRASGLFDEVVVAVGVNAGKVGALFTIDERIDLVKQVSAGYGNVRAEPFEGLLVDFCARHGIRAIMKGLRAVSDYEYELQMSHMNHRLSGIETLFVASNPLYSYLSSSLLKEVASLGGDISGLVPDLVLSALTDRLAERKKKSA